MRRMCWIVAGMLLASVAWADPPSQVFSPPRRPRDARLTPYHLDRPFPFTAEYSTREAWETRAQELRTQVMVALGLWPLPEKTPLHPVIHGKIDRDDYTIEKVYFASMPGHYVCGNLYRPKNVTGKLPVVLNPHGHFNNGRFFEESPAAIKANLASGGEKREDGAKYPLQACAVGLCRLGCIVFHYDMVGNADSQVIPHRAGFSGIDAELRLQSFAGLQTWNSIRALDFVCQLPDVDVHRIGVTGASGGGTQTFLLCAVDPRPSVSFPAVMVSANMQGGCICENASLLRVGTNNVELAALFAPKPQAMTGADDWTRDIESRGLPELKRIYALFGARENVHAKHYPFPHNYNQVSREMLYGWFNKHFRLGHPEPIQERAFSPVPPKELSVFNHEHPQPADFLKPDALRKIMTDSSIRQLQELQKSDPALYAETLRAAFQAICATKLPAAGSVQATQSAETRQPNYVLWKGSLQREGSGEELPLLVISPPEGLRNGIAVIWAETGGKATLLSPDGQLTPPARRLIRSGAVIVAGDLFWTGEWLGAKPSAFPMPAQVHHKDIPFLGFWLGYNRSVPAQRVHDLLTLLEHARSLPGILSVRLLGRGEAGPCALLANALTGGMIEKCAVDLNDFDFDQVDSPRHPMLLPGAMKYGGMGGILTCCGTETSLHPLVQHRWTRSAVKHDTLVAGTSLLPPASNIVTRPRCADPDELVDWLLK